MAGPMRPILLEAVTERRGADALKEIRRHYPQAHADVSVDRQRGVVTILDDRFVVSKEFVETEESLGSRHCMSEYARTLMGKARLVVVVPKDRAVGTRLRLLELNNWWLFYYQLYYYNDDGGIVHMDRRRWCQMSGRPYQEPPRAPEIA